MILRLERNVAVCTVDDAADFKIPRVVRHTFDSRYVLAREGNTCKIEAA